MVARLDEATGNLSGAADAFRGSPRSTAGPGPNTSPAWPARARLGRKDAALKAGRDLLAAAPGQLDNHQFFADLCFQLGQVDEGLDALRRAVRLNEADPKALLNLAETLAGQFRTEEAIEMFWRAFDKSPDLEARLSVVTRLTALYLQRNQFDRLLARLERQGREADRQREMTMCLAQAYSASATSGPPGRSWSAALGNPRDTKLLTSSRSPGRVGGRPRRPPRSSRSSSSTSPRATSRTAGWPSSTSRPARSPRPRPSGPGSPRPAEADSHRVLMALDSLLGSGKKEAVLGITENLLRKRPGNWEALYREGQALAGLDRPAEAAARFRVILAHKGGDDEVGAVAKGPQAGLRPPADPASRPAPGVNSYAPTKSFPLQDRLGKVYSVRGASGSMAATPPAQAWSPDDFGQARMASVGWLYALAQKAGTSEASSLVRAAEKAPADPRAALGPLLSPAPPARVPRAVRGRQGARQGRRPRPTPRRSSPSSTPCRSGPTRTSRGRSSTPRPAEADRHPPLPRRRPRPGPRLAYRALRAQKPDWIHAAILTAVADELKRARRGDDRPFYKAAVDGSPTTPIPPPASSGSPPSGATSTT